MGILSACIEWANAARHRKIFEWRFYPRCITDLNLQCGMSALIIALLQRNIPEAGAFRVEVVKINLETP